MRVIVKSLQVTGALLTDGIGVAEIGLLAEIYTGIQMFKGAAYEILEIFLLNPSVPTTTIATTPTSRSSFFASADPLDDPVTAKAIFNKISPSLRPFSSKNARSNDYNDPNVNNNNYNNPFLNFINPSDYGGLQSPHQLYPIIPSK